MMTTTSLVSIAIGLAAFAAGPAAAESFSIKQTVVGSMIPQPVVTSPVPIDETWAQLSDAQKAVVASDYEALPAGDEPPFPAQGLARIAGYVADYAQMTSRTGAVVAAVTVGPEGQARSVTVYKSPDTQLTHVVTAALMDETYKAAKCGGTTCAMQYVLRLDIPTRNGGQHVTGATSADYVAAKRGM